MNDDIPNYHCKPDSELRRERVVVSHEGTAVIADQNEPRVPGQPVKASSVEGIYAWVMEQKHRALFEQGEHRQNGRKEMETRAAGRAAALSEVQEYLGALMLKAPNASGEARHETT